MTTRPEKSPSEPPLVLTSTRNRVGWIRLNRPEKRNPLSLAMLQALQEAVDEALKNKDVRVLVIASTGPVFSAGHDLREMQGGATREDREKSQRTILSACSTLMTTLTDASKPVIASVAGVATAGGAQLAASADLLLASTDAQFCTPGVNVGGFCTTPLVAIGRKMRRNHAMELALTGDLFSAEDAFRFGLANRLYAPEALERETQALAERIAGKSAAAIRTGKKAFYQQMDMPLREAYVFATERMIESGLTDDAKEGAVAFFEKRDPQWTDI